MSEKISENLGITEMPKSADTTIEQIKERAREFQAEMEKHYEDFHENPELGGQEVETAKKIEEYLKNLGMEIVGDHIGIERPNEDPKKAFHGTGIVAKITGKEGGPMIALRADMDALPIKESADNPVRSNKDGVMHGCGHDLHSAGLMGAAKILKELADQGKLDGEVLLMFQPSEEKAFQKESGAIQMVKFLEKKGLRDKIMAFFGAHGMRSMERGQVNLKEGVQLASSGEVDIKLTAAGGHIMNAYEVPNLNFIFSQITTKLENIFRPLAEKNEALVASGRTTYEGSGYNVLPAAAESTWVIRISSELYKSMSKDVLFQIRQAIGEVVAQNKFSDKIKVGVKNRPGYRPVTARSPELVEVARNSASQSVEDYQPVSKTLLAGEDFSFYLEKFKDKEIPGVFALVGGANPEKGIPKGSHHTPDFRLDPEMIHELAALHSTFAVNAIEHYNKVKK